MIKYLRDKISGRPAFDDNIPPMKKINSQNSLNDVMSISATLNSNDILSSDRTASQVEKLNAAVGGGSGINSGHRSIYSSSPIIIPKNPPRSNASSQSSSSYTSVADQISSFNETSSQIHDGKLIDINIPSLPTLPSTCQYLEHSAARDRIAVKNRRRQPIKQKLGTLKENDDLFSSTQDNTKVQQSMVDTTRTRLRDHSADNIIPTYGSPVQRSLSFKRPQEINEIKFLTRTMFQNTNVNSSSQEHIYDNLDLFKRHKTILTSENESESSTNNIVQTREHSTAMTTRLRPVTMLLSTDNDKQTINEFENVFNQLKKRSSIKKVEPNEETIPEPIQPLPSYVPIENEPIVVTSFVSQQTPNRRKTVTGVHLSANNKVAADDNNKPTPSWVDIAKQKQTKFQSVSTESSQHEEHEQPQQYVSKNQVPISCNVAVVKENISEDPRSNRKSMYEPTIVRRSSPTNTHAIERDSIRALKAGNPNRINNLIQLFDK